MIQSQSKSSIILIVLKYYITCCLPLFALMAFIISGRSNDGWARLFVLSIWLMIFVVSKQLFGKTKERDKQMLEGDWTLPLSMALHTIMGTILIIEYFFINVIHTQPPMKYLLFGTGLLIIILSAQLRRWAIRCLGSQWSTHALGEKKIKKIRIVTVGPFKYVRHPIYVSWILDSLAFPLAWGTPISFVFAFLVVTPVYIIRATLEERASIQRFGKPYLRYMTIAHGFLPIGLIYSRPIPMLYKRKSTHIQ